MYMVRHAVYYNWFLLFAFNNPGNVFMQICFPIIGNQIFSAIYNKYNLYINLRKCSWHSTSFCFTPSGFVSEYYLFSIIMSAFKAFCSPSGFYFRIQFVLHNYFSLSVFLYIIIYFFFQLNHFQFALPSFYLFYKKTIIQRLIKMESPDKYLPAFVFHELLAQIVRRCWVHNDIILKSM